MVQTLIYIALIFLTTKYRLILYAHKLYTILGTHTKKNLFLKFILI